MPGVEEPLEGRVVVERAPGRPRAPPAPPRPSSPPRAAMWSTSSDTRVAEPRVEPRRLGVAVRLEPRQARLDDLALGERPLADALEEGRVDSRTRPTIASTTARVSAGASPVRIIRYSRCSTMPETRVHHRGEGRDRDDVARRLDRLLLGLALDLLAPLVGGARRQVAQLATGSAACRCFSSAVSAAVALPGRLDRALVDRARLGRQALRHERPHLVEPHEALRGLLGVVEGVRVQERPHELPAHVLEAELEVRVLPDGVVAALEGERPDRLALRAASPPRPRSPAGSSRCGRRRSPRRRAGRRRGAG